MSSNLQQIVMRSPLGVTKYSPLLQGSASLKRLGNTGLKRLGNTGLNGSKSLRMS